MAVLHTNSHLFMEIYYAAAFCGIILVPLNHRLSTGELTFWCNDSGVTYLISEYIFKEKVEAVEFKQPERVKVEQIQAKARG